MEVREEDTETKLPIPSLHALPSLGLYLIQFISLLFVWHQINRTKGKSNIKKQNRESENNKMN